MPKLHGFNKKELLDVYRKMVIARRLDEKMMTRDPPESQTVVFYISKT